MLEQQSQGLVRYSAVDSDYLQQRQLKQGASVFLLWALGVGAVISGEFSGWNTGLLKGGFTGLLIATALMATFYVCLTFSIAELAAALPYAGGFYSYTRYAFGPIGGFICGVSSTIEYILTPAVIVYFIGAYIGTLVPAIPAPVWWILFYLTFVSINIRGMRLSLRITLGVTIVAISLLLLFSIPALQFGAFRWDLLFTLPPDPGASVWLPKGWYGIFAAIPYAIWFYLGIEEIPLSAEEAQNGRQDVPIALKWGMGTLLGLSFLILIVNSGVLPGVETIGASNTPLKDGFTAVFGTGGFTTFLTLIALPGLIASFHSMIFGYGRILFSLSRAGYLPRWVSVTGRFNTPAKALILGALIGLVFLLPLQLTGGSTTIGAAVLTMAVFGAVLSYIFVLLSYIKLKLAHPDLPRPYQSPLGLRGAGLGLALAIIALAACFADPAYQPALVGVVMLQALLLAYFLVDRRHKLVAQAPEEQTALSQPVDVKG